MPSHHGYFLDTVEVKDDDSCGSALCRQRHTKRLFDAQTCSVDWADVIYLLRAGCQYMYVVRRWDRLHLGRVGELAFQRIFQRGRNELLSVALVASRNSLLSDLVHEVSDQAASL